MVRGSATTLIVMCFCKTISVSFVYKRGSEQNLLLSSVDYGKPIKHLSHESSNFCRRMMLRMCIWFVASIFLLSRRQRSVEQWYLNMISWSTPNRMICLWMKSTTATLVARCEESRFTSASLWVVSFRIHDPSVWEFKNALMDLQSMRDGIEEATLCIDTSISRVAELVKERRENTGVVSTVCSFCSRLLYLFNGKWKACALMDFRVTEALKHLLWFRGIQSSMICTWFIIVIILLW